MSFAGDAANIIAQQTALLTQLQTLPGAVQASLATGGTVSLYVNPLTGSDANLGTAASPLASLVRACQLAPQGRLTTIYLPASSGITCHMSIADSPSTNGQIDLTGKLISVKPQGGSTGPASMPNIVFDTISQGGQNACVTFSGWGSIYFNSCTINFPTRVDPLAAVTYTYAFAPSLGNHMGVAFVGCHLIIATPPAISMSGGLLNLEAYACTFDPAVNLQPSVMRLVLSNGARASIGMIGNVVPAGLNLGSLIELGGGARIAPGAASPPSVFSNVTSW